MQIGLRICMLLFASFKLMTIFASPNKLKGDMAHHLSAKKRIRQTDSKRVKNKYYARTTRNAVKKLRGTMEKEAAAEQYAEVVSMLDKLAKNNVIHKNKASNLKSKLAKHVNSL
jgi:small subunit ribosomal protein S20